MATQIKEIKKRNGETVAFSPEKIITAMRKSFAAQNVPIGAEKLHEMVQSVIETLASSGEKVPHVENVQDMVERSIMQAGHFDVAKAYILYRYQHKKERQAKVVEKIEENALLVTKRDGRKERFSKEKLRKTLSYHIRGYEDVINVEAAVSQCEVEVYDDIKTEDVSRVLVMALRTMIERDPAYSRVAARVLLSTIYKEVIGPEKYDPARLEEQHREAFVRNIHRGIEVGRLDKRLLEFDLESVSRKLRIERDDLFDFMGLQTIYDRYFVRDDETRKVLETPQMFWMRVALGTAIDEKAGERNHWVDEFYEIMSDFSYTPSTPTLFHAGTPKPQLSSCYLNTVPDSLEGIFKNYTDNAQLSKWSGGLGTDWTNIRGTGAFIKGTGVESQGVIPFLKIANDVTVAINRSGRRRGAACVYLETWHYDIMDFLELRKNTGDERRRAHDMDTANWIPDLFMKRVKEDGDWTLFSPEETPELHHIYGKEFERKYTEYEEKANRGEIKTWRRIKATDLWKKMLAMLFETGHPWITFKDPSNIRSPQDHVGVVHNSNLCTEITLNTSFDETAVCNLGSLNLAKFVKNGEFDVERVGTVTQVAMRMLDNVIDINFYPTEDARRSNFRHRPVGIGIRGFHDALYMLGINYDSERAVQFSDESMEVVSYHAIFASSKLAKERGAYETYKGSKWDRGLLPQDTLDLLESERGMAIPVPRNGKLDWTPVRQHIREFGMRNSNCMAIAPTATTANIVGCVPTIEPIYKNLYVKSNQAGDFVVVNKYLVEELKQRGLWNKEMLGKIKYHDGSIQDIVEIPVDVREKYKEVFEIDPRWLVRGAAARGKWIDQSQSLNVFFRGTSGKDLSELYFYVWEMGLKTTYYLRTLGASQVEKSTVNTSEYGDTHKRKGFIVRGKREAVVQETSGSIPTPQAQPVVAASVPEGGSKASIAGHDSFQVPESTPVRKPSVYIADGSICESCEG